MEKLENSPTYWYIDFERLDNDGRKLMLPKLKDFFKKYIDTLPIVAKYKIAFKVDGQWHSKQLTPEVYKQLMNNLTENHFIFDIENVVPEYFYEEGAEKIPEWSLFSAVRFNEFKDFKANKDLPSSKLVYNDVGGSFFQYLVNKNCPLNVIKYLKKLQIFTSLVNKKGKQRKELDDCCFIYALQQTGCYDDATLNKMRLRINTRYLSQKSLNELCMEFKLHIKLSFIDEDANGKNKKRSVRSQKNCKDKYYLGIDKRRIIQ